MSNSNRPSYRLHITNVIKVAQIFYRGRRLSCASIINLNVNKGTTGRSALVEENNYCFETCVIIIYRLNGLA